jgi:hypothetical protein
MHLHVSLETPVPAGAGRRYNWGRPMKLLPLVLAVVSLVCPIAAEAQGIAAPGAVSSAMPSAGPLSCAIEWRDRQPEPQALCEAIGRTLGRAIQRVDDARAVARGDSVQVLDGDVFWTTIWLRNGKVRSYTRVSKTAAQGKEVAVLTRAIREISRMPPKTKGCVRVEPNGGRKMRSPDLVYPWAELRRCKTTKAEVPDPWTT